MDKRMHCSDITRAAVKKSVDELLLPGDVIPVTVDITVMYENTMVKLHIDREEIKV